MSEDRGAAEGARAIHSAFITFQGAFDAITRRARARFESCDWRGGQRDAVERLELYPETMRSIVLDLLEILRDRISSHEQWKRIKRAYSVAIREEPNRELAETFYNSVTRRIFATVGVDPQIEYVSLEPDSTAPEPIAGLCRFRGGDDLTQLMRRILATYRLGVDYVDAARDAQLVADEVRRYLRDSEASTRIDAVETLRPVFYRGKGAYVIGRILSGRRKIPLVLPLHNDGRGVYVDAVLMSENEVSILFSFARSYFHVASEFPRELVAFLKSILPRKPTAELYISIGFNKHGKTELYRDLRRHLAGSSDAFRAAEGDRGMVMIVFTLPSFDTVFKVIRDRFDYPKDHTRREVMERYRLVFKRDRVGRLVDAQEFEHLSFRRERFTGPLLEEFRREARQAVAASGDAVVIKHLYTERKVTPLNLFLRSSAEEEARRAVVEYGEAIRELAEANIFPGDFLLKNFGVTRHGRVVFYDYDELCLLTDCRFRRIPPPRTPEEELEAEPWFTAGPNEIFPEEFRRFLGLPRSLKQTFLEHHEDLLSVEFWSSLQQRHRAGQIMDFFPYPRNKRLQGD